LRKPWSISKRSLRRVAAALYHTLTLPAVQVRLERQARGGL